MKEKFKDRTIDGSINIKMDDSKGVWKGDKRVIVDSIISISEEYMNNGYNLTLRQLYYQLVARDIIPNHDKVYAKISSIKDDVVYSGLVDWDTFEDRGRVPIQAYFENSVKGALQRTINSYKLDRQLGQNNHIEVWTEKDAISSILRRATDPYTIRLVVNKGYTSSTAIYGAYERFIEQFKEGKKVKILYFGDHDPSGLDMIRDIRERLMFMFTQGEQKEDSALEDKIHKWTYIEDPDDPEQETLSDYAWDKYQYNPEFKYPAPDDDLTDWTRAFFDDHFEVIPVGLTMEQIKQYNPPHNPAKITDPRAKNYIKEYGAVSWEVDALTPSIMLGIVEKAISDQMDNTAYRSIMDKEKDEKDKIVAMIKTL